MTPPGDVVGSAGDGSQCETGKSTAYNLVRITANNRIKVADSYVVRGRSMSGDPVDE